MKGDTYFGFVADLNAQISRILDDIESGLQTVPDTPKHASSHSVMSKFEELGFETCQVYADLW